MMMPMYRAALAGAVLVLAAMPAAARDIAPTQPAALAERVAGPSAGWSEARLGDASSAATLKSAGSAFANETFSQAEMKGLESQ